MICKLFVALIIVAVLVEVNAWVYSESDETNDGNNHLASWLWPRIIRPRIKPRIIRPPITSKIKPHIIPRIAPQYNPRYSEGFFGRVQQLRRGWTPRNDGNQKNVPKSPKWRKRKKKPLKRPTKPPHVPTDEIDELDIEDKFKNNIKPKHK